MFRLILDAILGLFGVFLNKKQATAERAGATEAANVALREGVETIKRANEAAKKVDTSKEAVDVDPDNLDARK